MSRKRTLSPGWAKHADLFDAEVSSGLPLRVAFAALWTVTDRRGVFAWSRSLKPDVLPYDAVDMLAVLDALAAAQFVVRYEVGGKVCGYIPSFEDHQHFHRNEQPSNLPSPPDSGTETDLAPREDGPCTTSDGRLAASGYRLAASGLTTSAQKAAPDGDFLEAWAGYPKRTGGNSRTKALKAWSARRRAGVPAADLSDGLRRYAAFVKATGREGSQYVMQAATFFGPDEHFLESWTIPAIIVTPPRTPFVSVTEQAAKQDAASLEVERQYSAARHKAGAVWAKHHPAEFEPIRALVEASYRGIPGEFGKKAATIELATRCGSACGFPDFDEWRASHRNGVSA